MSSSLEEINLQIIRLKKLKFDFAHQKGILDVTGAELDEVKQAIMDELKEAKALSYKTETGTVSINRRQTVKIIDETAVKNWMEAQGWELDEYTKLDPARTKPILENAVYVQGEVIDGTSLETSEYISLREPTQKKEQV
jgi:hypothetical protein